MMKHRFLLLAVCAEAATITPNIADPACNAPNLSPLGIAAEQSCIDHDGITRCWYTYIPDSARSASGPAALVYDLHGYNLCGAYSAEYTGWDRVADEGGFVVVWPQGVTNAEYANQPCWDVGACCCFRGEPAAEGGWPPAADIDDAGFLRQIASNVLSSAAAEGVQVDATRLYFAGHSNGCMMAQSMAALQSDLVAAVCCHASSLMVEPSADYKPRSVQVVLGELDPVIEGIFGSENHVLETWGPINGCTANNTEVDESGLYATHTLSNCSDNTIIQTVEVFNGGHFPYLGVPPNFSLSVGEYPGAVTPEVDTTKLSWEFCTRYQSDEEPELPPPVQLVAPDVFAEEPMLEPTINGTVEPAITPTFEPTISPTLGGPNLTNVPDDSDNETSTLGTSSAFYFVPSLPPTGLVFTWLFLGFAVYI